MEAFPPMTPGGGGRILGLLPMTPGGRQPPGGISMLPSCLCAGGSMATICSRLCSVWGPPRPAHQYKV